MTDFAVGDAVTVLEDQGSNPGDMWSPFNRADWGTVVEVYRYPVEISETLYEVRLSRGVCFPFVADRLIRREAT